MGVPPLGYFSSTANADAATDFVQYPAAFGRFQTRVLEAGRQDSPLVVALHGVAARADRWKPAMPMLANAGYRVAAVDLPGHGLATKSAAVDCSVNGTVAALIELCRGLRRDDEKVLLLGTSLGGLYAGALALAAPDLIRGLVLVCSLGLEPLGPEGRAAFSASIVRTAYEDNVRKLNVVLYDDALVTEVLVREETLMNSSPGSSEALARYARYFAEEIDDDLILEGLAASIVPVMFVWGAHDSGVPVAIGHRAHARIERSVLTVIDDAAHAPYFEKPSDFCRPVIEFMNGLEPVP
ncbi:MULTISPECIES: alpha/beta fold hydrolase [unclassified Mycolicibacterium]|uniref:alpha/beta fold hydrolase n=1 Tax=unclassified Mycolicibacterium TaxID=2636767 RepID=UPI0013915B3A|nr:MULTISPECIES: alpha/beta fold hydrolase [unclassified Mycolicibacterium]